jgi:UPF0716 family protein affecting phage T7 exclusion
MEHITIAHVIGFLSAIVVFLIGAFMGTYFAQALRKDHEEDYYSVKILMRQAVQLGFANWEVDRDGNSTFKWNKEN